MTAQVVRSQSAHAIRGAAVTVFQLNARSDEFVKNPANAKLVSFELAKTRAAWDGAGNSDMQLAAIKNKNSGVR